MNKIENRFIDTENRMAVVQGRGFGGLVDKGERIKKHKLVVTE